VCEWKIISVSPCNGSCNITSGTSAPTSGDDKDHHKDDDDKKHKDDDDQKYKDCNDEYNDGHDEKYKRYINEEGDDKDHHKDDEDEKHKDDDDHKHKDDGDRSRISSTTPTATTTSNATNSSGIQIVVRACFCGNQQVDPSNCSSNYTVFEIQPCSLNCGCSWVSVSAWSNCPSSCGGKQYQTRQCNCTQSTCGSTRTKRAHQEEGHHEREHQEEGHHEGEHQEEHHEGEHQEEEAPSQTLPKATYSYACGGYDVVFKDCTPCVTSHIDAAVTEVIASKVVRQSTPTSNLLWIIIPSIITVIVVFAVLLVLGKTSNNQKLQN